MIIIGPFTHKFADSNWECDEYPGQLCHTGLQAALDTELETSNSYELRIYPKRPRGDVSKLVLDHDDNVKDENGENHELDWQLVNVIAEKFPNLKDKDNKTTFYVRVLDLGLAPKIIDHTWYDEDANVLHMDAEDGTSAEIEIDLEDVIWS